MKRLLCTLLLLLTVFFESGAVVKERSLNRTLGVLRSELRNDCKQQESINKQYSSKEAELHQQLSNYVAQCNQYSIMLFSQKQRHIISTAYACRQVKRLYGTLSSKDGEITAYNSLLNYLDADIELKERLIHVLESIPPLMDKENADEYDEKIINALDSLNTLTAASDSLAEAELANIETQFDLQIGGPDDEEKDNEPDEPLFLEGDVLACRDSCVAYATSLLEGLQLFRDKLEADSRFYDNVKEKVQDLNDFADNGFEWIQKQVFVDGTENYFSILFALKSNIMNVSSSIRNTYSELSDNPDEKSDWRGINVLRSSLFTIFYFLIVFAVVSLIIRFCIPKKWRSADLKERGLMLSNIITFGILLILSAVAKKYFDLNYMMVYSLNTLQTFLWMMFTVLLASYLRLDPSMMQKVTQCHLPFMLQTFLLSMFRVTLAPDRLVALLVPTILLIMTIVQICVVKKRLPYLSAVDSILVYVTSIIMVAGVILSWVGYNHLVILIQIWWMMELTYIEEIVFVFTFAKKNRKSYFKKEWLYSFITKCLVPLLLIDSIQYCIMGAANIYELGDNFKELMDRKFINEEGLIMISANSILNVTALFFIFRYISLLINILIESLTDKTGKKESFDHTLSRNIIAILTWGIYVISVLVILQVPKSGISVVTAGLATGLGFAMKDLIENFVYGIQLMAGRLRVGDIIECNGIQGHVENITYQATMIRTSDGGVVSVLNGTLFKENFKNKTRNSSYMRVKTVLSVQYGTDFEKAKNIITDAIAPLYQLTNAKGKQILNSIPPDITIDEFQKGAVVLNVVVWTDPNEREKIHALICAALYKALSKEDVKILA